jgi:hypothetical protein
MWYPPLLSVYRPRQAKAEHLCRANVQKTLPHSAAYLFQAGESWNTAGRSTSQNFPGVLC